MPKNCIVIPSFQCCNTIILSYLRFDVVISVVTIYYRFIMDETNSLTTEADDSINFYLSQMRGVAIAHASTDGEPSTSSSIFDSTAYDGDGSTTPFSLPVSISGSTSHVSTVGDAFKTQITNEEFSPTFTGMIFFIFFLMTN